MVYLLEKTFERSQKLRAKGLSAFEVRNDMQVFYAQHLSIVYGQVKLTHSHSTTALHLYVFSANDLQGVLRLGRKARFVARARRSLEALVLVRSESGAETPRQFL